MADLLDLPQLGHPHAVRWVRVHYGRQRGEGVLTRALSRSSFCVLMMERLFSISVCVGTAPRQREGGVCGRTMKASETPGRATDPGGACPATLVDEPAGLTEPFFFPFFDFFPAIPLCLSHSLLCVCYIFS